MLLFRQFTKKIEKRCSLNTVFRKEQKENDYEDQ